MSTITQFLAASAAASVVLGRYAPEYTLGQSYLLTAIAFFFGQFFVWATYKVVIYPKFLSPLRNLPQPSGGSFFNGHFRTISDEPSGDPAARWTEEIPNDGLIVYRHLFNRERLLLTNPKTLGEVLVHKNYEFIKPHQFRVGLGRILGIGILLAEGDEHKTQRKNLMPAFAFRHIKELYPGFWEKSKEMVDTIAQHITSTSSNVVEVGAWTSRATLDIIGVAGMGQDFGALQNPNNKLSVTYKTIFNPPKYARYMQLAGAFLPQWFLRALPIKRNTEIEDASEFIKQTCRDLITAKKAKMEKAERTEVDILSVAIESGGFNDEELVNQMMTFLVAGHETTSTAMMWAIYLLCKHQDVQTKLRQEVHSRLPPMRDPSAQITAADVDGCHYLHAVCSEVLRVWAPVALTMRIAAHNTTIGDQFVPKNTMVIVAPRAINLSTKLWGPDAKEFNPDRWMKEGQANKGGADSNYSFLTFLHGPRSCIGLSFSRAEFACLLAAWVGRFETSFENDDYVLEIKGGVTSKPKGGLCVKLNEIKDW